MIMSSALQKFAFLLISMILISGCGLRKGSEELLDMNTYFIVGEGGGFAGTYIQYKINQNGRIEQFDFNDYIYLEIAKVSPSEVDDFFNRIEDLELGELEISSPGNMSRYIEINYMDINDHKLIWAMESSSIQPEVISFFTDSFNYCKKLSE